MRDEAVKLKKLKTQGKISFWLVDGNYLRQNIDEDFTNFGQHYRFPFIPEYELWFDREAKPDEMKFFIDHLLHEWKLMRSGLTYDRALDKADAKERSERKKAGDLEKLKDKNGRMVKGKVYCRRLKVLAPLTVWLVDGRLVRSAYDIDFTEGGHDLVYSYVPKNEIWIDNDVIKEERPYIIFHELKERGLMKRGASYNAAHAQASRQEWQLRHDQRLLKKELFKLGWKD